MSEPWKDKKAFEFSGVIYAVDDAEMTDIMEVIADAVCPNGGTVVSKPALWGEDFDDDNNGDINE